VGVCEGLMGCFKEVISFRGLLGWFLGTILAGFNYQCWLLLYRFCRQDVKGGLTVPHAFIRTGHTRLGKK